MSRETGFCSGHRQLAACLAVAFMLFSMPSAFAEGVLAENRGASEDQTAAASLFSEELSDTDRASYYRKESTSYLTSMILSMAEDNAYRLILDNGYPDISGSALNVSESARTIWQVLADGYAAAPRSFLLESAGGSDTYYSAESAAKVSNILRRILGAGDERLANFDGTANPEELWTQLKDLAQEDVYSWEDTVFAGGEHPVHTGDPVYFKISAFCGGCSGEQSHTLHRKVWHDREPGHAGQVTEWFTAEDPDTGEETGSEGHSAKLMDLSVTKPYEISFVYVGMVLSAGPEGIRCICGSLDFTDTGMFSQDGEPAQPDGNGTASYVLSAGEPEWYISVTVQFCSSVIDTEKMMKSFYSTYVVEQGPKKGTLISFDINDPDLVRDLEEKTGYTEEQCVLLANEMRILYLTEELEAGYGLTVAESLAWQQALLLFSEGDFSGEGIRSALPENRRQDYTWWLDGRGEEATTGNFMEFLQESMEADGALMEEIRTCAVTETGSIPENLLADTRRILKWYFGVSLTDPEIRKMLDGSAYTRGSLEGYLSDFLQGLAGGAAEIGYLMPYPSGGEGGLLEWIDPAGDEYWTVPTAPEKIVIRAQENREVNLS